MASPFKETNSSRSMMLGKAGQKMLVKIPKRNPIELISYYDEFAWYYPTCEMETKRWFVDNVQGDWCIFDIGANVGYYTILFSRLAPDGQIFAFEPTSTEAMLRANLAHHQVKNVEIHKVAVGRQPGLREDDIFRIWGRDAERSEYPFVSIDSFVQERKVKKVDCVKIDVDSFDFEVLQGAVDTLQTYDPYVVVELNHALSRRQQSNAEAMAWLSRLGYSDALVLDFDNFVLKRVHHRMIDHSSCTSSITLHFPLPENAP
jgi:FkbM family methyltransferase